MFTAQKDDLIFKSENMKTFETAEIEVLRRIYDKAPPIPQELKPKNPMIHFFVSLFSQSNFENI